MAERIGGRGALAVDVVGVGCGMPSWISLAFQPALRCVGVSGGLAERIGLAGHQFTLVCVTGYIVAGVGLRPTRTNGCQVVESIIGVLGAAASRVGLSQQVAPIGAPFHGELLPGVILNAGGTEVGIVGGIHGTVERVRFFGQDALLVVGVGLGMVVGIVNGGATVQVIDDVCYQFAIPVELAGGAPGAIVFGAHGFRAGWVADLRHAVGGVVGVSPRAPQQIGGCDQIASSVVSINDLLIGVV